MAKNKVLVTGAAGYLGSVLCERLLRDGFSVLGVDVCTYHNEAAVFHLLGDDDFDFLLADVRDTETLRPLLRDVAVVIPLAAVVGAPACAANPDYARAVNTTAIRDLLKCVSPNQRVVFPNTNSGYGHTSGKNYVAEDSPLLPISLYATTKAEAERMILDHPLGVSLRLATVFGPSPRMRFDLLVNDFVATLFTQGKLEVFEPGYQRNLVHVRDVARVFSRMLADHRLCGTYNVGLPDANFSKLELAYTIAGIMHLYPMDHVTVGDGADPDGRNYRVSNAKLLATGFQFRYDLEKGVRAVAQMVSLLPPGATRKMRNTP